MTATPYADQNSAWLNAENTSTYLQEALQSALLDLDNAKNNLENIYPYYDFNYHFRDFDDQITHEIDDYKHRINNIIDNLYSSTPEAGDKSSIDNISSSLWNLSDDIDYYSEYWHEDYAYRLDYTLSEANYKIDSIRQDLSSTNVHINIIDDGFDISDLSEQTNQLEFKIDSAISSIDEVRLNIEEAEYLHYDYLPRMDSLVYDITNKLEDFQRDFEYNIDVFASNNQDAFIDNPSYSEAIQQAQGESYDAFDVAKWGVTDAHQYYHEFIHFSDISYQLDRSRMGVEDAEYSLDELSIAIDDYKLSLEGLVGTTDEIIEDEITDPTVDDEAITIENISDENVLDETTRTVRLWMKVILTPPIPIPSHRSLDPEVVIYPSMDQTTKQSFLM